MLTSSLADCVDLDRYPIHDLGSPRGQQLITQSRESLATNGVCLLDGFLTDKAIESGLAAATVGRTSAWTANQEHNPYFVAVPDNADPQHPYALMQRSVQHAIAYDLMPADSLLRALYESPELLSLVAAALDRETLYRSSDPLDALDISLFDPGDELGWHFDNSEFSVTIMLQDAEAGGYFEYIPATRTRTDERFAEISAFLRGVGGVGGAGLLKETRLAPQPGTLSLFQGHLAMHRVSPVEVVG